ncbi:bifunctional hydroxymethylpyrimidine kinase/phosphomethylpyrimidine kinase [Pediococcus pentosaceus]|uniref:bifunctional hydroxymethylpyrimidine kinase/phosphomethylpyrimidine kinase n=1 Tax=Pediococcus pentosaceus TaxID=1255 RepID=UPI0010086C56|nr:bifunctional hydroxymethylpyrimidine kinase/phosphomethylpyrimidine kinase [Pediococcus pentosaceus]RXI21167.1 bifunctional hydroxymethylpyrimidine kinase/phosphomethylpyrimidine kinase [Pediococcus pentosaceus]
MSNEFPQALTIAGSDSDGSAGMEADMNTFQRRNVHGMCVMTACVAGNSYGIQASHALPTDFVDQEFQSLAADFKIRASKTGMLADSPMIETVVKNHQKFDFGPLVLDPVIITKHGALLLEEEAFETLKQQLIPLATVITPNFYEAIKLTGIDIKNDDDTIQAAHILQEMGAKNVMLKGSHKPGEQTEVRDFVLLEDGSSFWLSEPYIETDRVNGTGDVLSACITAEIAKGTDIPTAIRIAKKFVTAAIANPIAVGHKYGPVNHLAKFQASSI